MTVTQYRGILSGDTPFKPLSKGIKRMVGRQSSGKITVRHKGAGAKRLWREVDFRYEKIGIPARIETIEYDPNRSGFISLVCYNDGERRYHLIPAGMKVGDEIVAGESVELRIGNRLRLDKIPVGWQVYNIEVNPNTGAKLVRSAGSAAEILAHDAGFTSVKLPSGAVQKIDSRSYASLGQVSNAEHGQIVIGKAGRSRHMGIRPTVRGSAMNPVDHPYGGGEGRSPQGTRRPKNKWGKGTRGVKTRKRHKHSNSLIVSRRK